MNELDQRKHHHLTMAEASQIETSKVNQHFYYEPLFGTHPTNIYENRDLQRTFLGKTMQFPLWISSMTGGTGAAKHINQNLARACAEFKLGMGLGSIRPLLSSDEFFEDFNLRPILGEDRPFFGNLGIAQLEELLVQKNINKLHDIVGRLKADGMIIHINPLQEYYQPEGDRFIRPAIETLQEFLESVSYGVIVKEVGQGMGPRSLKALLSMPLAAVDFGAFGGTNFSYLEWNRNKEKSNSYELGMVGHSAEEMVILTNLLMGEMGEELRCKQIIISGGIKDYLAGYRLIKLSRLSAVYGQGHGILKHATHEYAKLKNHLEIEFRGLLMANQFLDVKGTH